MKRQQKVVAKSNSTERFVQGEHLFFYRSMRRQIDSSFNSLGSMIEVTAWFYQRRHSTMLGESVRTHLRPGILTRAEEAPRCAPWTLPWRSPSTS